MLLKLGEDYQSGREVAGVVLNDLGTIYQEGIGVGRDGLKAEYWFKQAYLQETICMPLLIWEIYTEKDAASCRHLFLWLSRHIENRKISMRFIVSDKPTRKDGQVHRIWKKLCSGIGKQQKKASSGSTKTGRIKQ